jgi:hypothetical protein
VTQSIALTEVIKAEFYAYMNPRNVCPRSEHDHSEWIDQRTYRILGKSEPGYASPHGTPERYFLLGKEGGAA